uniref:Immunoglobulin domain-containing protein n=1 Tax=Sinocyclocheilus rhinocerous TaxID=307959 RepID=A0A673LIS8_9TELE
MLIRQNDYCTDEIPSVSVMEGDSVTLYTDVTELQEDDEIEWRFNGILIATAGIFNTYDGADRRFRDRLQLDCFTGSLTIRNIGTRHSGLYEVDITFPYSLLCVFVVVTDAVKSLSVKEREYVTLQAVTEIQSNDHILWLFGDTVLAEIHKADQRFSTSDGPDERFRGRLKLNNQTGSLIITNTRTTDSGLYELKISSSRYTINRRFIVTVTGE